MFVRLSRLAWRDEDGSAVIEGALVIPVLMTLVFGVYDFSWYFYNQQLITTGVRDAARYISRSVSTNDATCGQNQGVWPTAIHLAMTWPSVSDTNWPVAAGSNVRVGGWTNPATITITCSANPPYAVQVNASFSGSTLGFFALLGLSAPAISASHQELIIGPG